MVRQHTLDETGVEFLLAQVIVYGIVNVFLIAAGRRGDRNVQCCLRCSSPGVTCFRATSLKLGSVNIHTRARTHTRKSGI